MHFFTKPKMADTDGASLLDSEILVCFVLTSIFFCISALLFFNSNYLLLKEPGVIDTIGIRSKKVFFFSMM